METATKSDVAFWACIVCGTVWSAAGTAEFSKAWAGAWLLAAVLIRVSDRIKRVGSKTPNVEVRRL